MVHLLDVKLNEGQTQAMELWREFIDDKDHYDFYLRGYAGTGKSLLVNLMMADTLLADKKVFLCAPTHKAVGVLKSYFRMTECQHHDHQFGTIHQMFSISPKINHVDGERMFRRKSDMAIVDKFLEVIFVDECSMIPKDIVEHFRTTLELKKPKIVFMGDPMQLPPINEKMGEIWKMADEAEYYKVFLTEVMRTTSAYIKDACIGARNWDGRRTDTLINELAKIHSEGDRQEFNLFLNKPDYEKTKWWKFVINCIKNGESPIILSFKNVTCDLYNKRIRAAIHGKDYREEYLENDILLFNNFYEANNDFVFYTSDKIKIMEMTCEKRKIIEWTHPNHLIQNPKKYDSMMFNNLLSKLDKMETKYEVITMTVQPLNRYEEDDRPVIRTISQKDVKKHFMASSTIKNHICNFNVETGNETLTRNLWDIYYGKYQDPYAELDYGYSITVHKSQGSTFENVLINASDFFGSYMDPSMKVRMLYTAATRASVHLGVITDA